MIGLKIKAGEIVKMDGIPMRLLRDAYVECGTLSPRSSRFSIFSWPTCPECGKRLRLRFSFFDLYFYWEWPCYCDTESKNEHQPR